MTYFKICLIVSFITTFIFSLLAMASVTKSLYYLAPQNKVVHLSTNQVEELKTTGRIEVPLTQTQDVDTASLIGLAISILGISAGLSTLIPYFVSRAEVQKTVGPIVKSEFKEFRDDLNQKFGRSIHELQKLDAHASRMIGWVLVEGGEAVVWGIGWLARSIKKYPDLLVKKPSYDELLFLAIHKMIIGFDQLTESNGQRPPSQRHLTISDRLKVNEEKEPLQPAVRACKDALDVLESIDRVQKHCPDLFTRRRVDYIESVLRLGTAVLLNVILQTDSRFETPDDLAKRVEVDAWSEEIPSRVKELLEKDFNDAYRDLRDKLSERDRYMGRASG